LASSYYVWNGQWHDQQVDVNFVYNNKQWRLEWMNELKTN
jgi:hypothetical protein